ncbi:MAG TPA: HlyD family efflux transporter periplasmic adaptor subunit, partial [Candidatus Intestinimonas stercorigallinarum]|nr:HlyD family efflux transporter periplasmic adaptor subunit [Candidatus Intestinimonas stercorigallinarum]
KSGETVIIISNNTNMVVEITVDDRNISFVQPGMTVDLTDYNGNIFVGTVSSIDMSLSGDSSSNGMTSYPVTLEVDNSAGTLMAGMWLDYSFVASQSDNCIVVPMQAVKYVSDTEGNTFSVLFVQADEKPENAVDIDIPPVEEGQTPTYPTPEDGYYPVPVVTGLDDNYNVEIKEGIEEGQTVFVNYLVTSGWG